MMPSTLSFRRWRHLVLLLTTAFLLPLGARAQQNVGIGTTAPHPKAALEVKSTTKGLLPPRMTQPERDAIAPGADAAGLTVYNTTTGKLNTWNGVRWEESLNNEPVRPTVTVTYSTPGTYLYVVPAGMTRLIVDARGAGGGASSATGGFAAPGGAGARLKASLAVTPGETLTINVGGAGESSGAGNAGGFNGGGNGGNSGGTTYGGGGGGASDVRRGAALTDRVLTAAGGGGGGGAAGPTNAAAGRTGAGGAGGYPTGGNGIGSTGDVGGGRGGTQTGPGPSSSPNAAYSPASLGQGSPSHSYFSGGGGGGYYGGNGGGVSVVVQNNTYFSDGGGGGGSSWLTATNATLLLTETAAGGGNGSVVLTAVPGYAAPALDASNFINVPGDNLGNHTATTNVGLSGNWLSNAPGNANGIRIDNSGDVTLSGRLGLGTSATPTEKLQIVNGNLQLTATSPVSVGISNANGSLNLALANGSGQYSDVAQTGDAVLRANGKRLILAGRDGGEVLVTTGPAGAELERLRITTAGLVRVSSLGGNGTQAVITDNGGNLAAVPFSSFSDNLGNHTATTNVGLNGNWLSNAPGNANGIRIDNSGNVGIGTGTPGAGLHVRTDEKSAVSNQTGVFVSGGASGNPNIELRSTSGATYLDFANDLTTDFQARILSTDNGLGFQTGGSATPQLLVSPNGSVGVGGAAPASAALAVTSTTQGFLPPRMSATERNNIGSPAAGLIIYNTTTNQVNTWNGTEWEATTPVTQGLPLGPAIATFGYTGAPQTFTVPAGVTSVVVTATGAVGGTYVGGGMVYQGGKGAQAQTVLTVTPGETLNVYVGGTGGFHAGNGAGPGGWNGGGNARGGGGGGGGATDLRRGGTALANRLVVAAGGGGSAYGTGLGGGDGGAPNGAPGMGGTGGGGATQQNGGQQAGYNSPQVAGSLGLGGDSDFYYGGAGGGGLYGGAGSRGNGGGGGSSWVTPTGTADTRLLAGVNAGNGSLSFSLPQAYPAPTLDGTNISGTWDVSGTDYYYTGGNVGIGTSSPAQKLDVVGTARVQGTLQVGTSAVPGAIEVVGASGTTTTTLDQQQLVAASGGPVITKWQSFTAGITGSLTQLDFHGGPTPGYGPAAGQLSFYAGEGTTGTLLGSQAVTYQQIGYNFQQFVLTTPVPVTAGQQYTFQLTAPAGASVFADGSGNNRYAGGRVDNDPFSDLAFKTYVATPNATRLLTVLPTGQMGLGTAAPSEKLDVVGGNVKISTTGNGLIFPDGTTQTTAAVSATSATFIQNQTTTQSGASFNVGGSGTIGGNATVNGPLGVVLNSQDRPLITRGYDAFTSGNYSGAGRWGVFMEPSTLTFGVPALAGKNFQWATYTANSAIGASLMTLTQAGQLGIGTTGSGPATTLDVRTPDNSAAITVGKTDATAGALYLGNSGHGVKRNYATGNDVGLYTTSGTLYLSANGTSTSQFALLNNGNVGIGTAIPGQKLEVNGTALINSGYDLLLRDAQHGLGWYGTGKTWNGTTPDGPVLYGFSGGVLGTKDGGARTVLAWNKNGRVGIGTAGPGHPLTVQAEGTGALLGFNTNGGTDKYNWSLSSGGLNLSESNVAAGRLFVKDGGNVGIGTTSPIAPLHVKGTASTSTAGGGYSFFSPGSGLGASSVGSGVGKQVSAYFEGGEVWVNGYVVAGALQTTSDRRIKHIIGLSDRAADLTLLNKLRITDYTYIDQVNHPGGQVVKKVIAQEVETVLPAAVTQSTQALPNVYERATRVTYANGQVTITTAKPHELPATGGRLRLYTPANAELNPEVTVVDAHTVRFASSDAYTTGLFVYGKWVDDFRSVDYDALTTLNVSATQELARQVAALEAENAALKAGAAAQQTQNAQTTATLQSLADRLRALEAGQEQARK